MLHPKLVLISFLIMMSPAMAQQNDTSSSLEYSKVFHQCMDAAGGVTPRMHDCIGTESAIWDKRLNAAYTSIMASDDYSPAVKAKLREAQRAWIAFKEKGCLADGDLEAEGGTLSSVIAADCELRLTAERATHLEEVIKQNGP